MILFFLDGWEKMGNDDFIGLHALRPMLIHIGALPLSFPYSLL